MNRGRRLGRVGGLVVPAAAAAPFVALWDGMMRSADDPLTVRARLDMAIWMAVFGTPWMVAAWLLWRAWWRRAGAELSVLDGPALLLAAAATTLPADRRDWGAAMTAELARVQDPAARWRFAAGCARAALYPPGGNRAAVAGALTFAALAATGLATDAALPAGRVFALSFVGLVGGLATLAVARSGRSFRSGLWACAWATMLGGLLIVVAWLAEAPRWYRQVGGLLLDGEGGVGMGANLGDAIWWTLIVVVLWALPIGVLGAAAGSAPARRRRAREHDLAPPA